MSNKYALWCKRHPVIAALVGLWLFGSLLENPYLLVMAVLIFVGAVGGLVLWQRHKAVQAEHARLIAAADAALRDAQQYGQPEVDKINKKWHER